MKTSKPKLTTSDNVLIVEGYSDLVFYAEILEWLGKPPPYIHDMNGVASLTSELELFLGPKVLGSKKSIAVIVDADHDAAARIASLENLLCRITDQKVNHGKWTSGPPRVGLFVVPGDGKAGEIESLAWEAWATDPANEDAAECVQSFLSCMAKWGHKAKSPDKGRINAMLAVLCDEDPRLGAGARQRLFDFTRHQYAPLIEFLRLF
jgi:hypothetical protein